jgi:hypothetical protein
MEINDIIKQINKEIPKANYDINTNITENDSFLVKISGDPSKNKYHSQASCDKINNLIIFLAKLPITFKTKEGKSVMLTLDKAKNLTEQILLKNNSIAIQDLIFNYLQSIIHAGHFTFAQAILKIFQEKDKDQNFKEKITNSNIIDLYISLNLTEKIFIERGNLLNDNKEYIQYQLRDLLKTNITKAIENGGLENLLSANLDNKRKNLLDNLIADARSNESQTSIELLKHIFIEAIKNGELTELLSTKIINKDNIEISLIKNLIANAHSNGNQTSIDLLKHVFTEAIKNGKLTELLSTEIIDKDNIEISLIKNLITDACSNGSQTSIYLLKHIFTEAIKNGKLTELLSTKIINNDNTETSLIKNLITDAHSENESKTSIELLKYIFTEAIKKEKLTELLSINLDNNSNNEGAGLIKNLGPGLFSNKQNTINTSATFLGLIIDLCPNNQINELLNSEAGQDKTKKPQTLLEIIKINSNAKGLKKKIEDKEKEFERKKQKSQPMSTMSKTNVAKNNYNNKRSPYNNNSTNSNTDNKNPHPNYNNNRQNPSGSKPRPTHTQAKLNHKQPQQLLT